MTAVKAAALILLSAESLDDARGFMDRLLEAHHAAEASKGQRYGGVYRRGYHDGADAAFAALRDYIDKGGRVGLPMGPDSLHLVDANGASFEILSLLALRPWSAA